MVTPEMATLARKAGIPVLKGKLFQLMDDGTERFVNENTVVLGGAILALEQLFGVNAAFVPPTVNSIYNVNSGKVATELDSRIKCFGLGIGGCAAEFGQIIDPDFKWKNLSKTPTDFIPFRVANTTVLTGTDATKYYFRRQINTSPAEYGWYLKEFEANPEIKSLWKDNPTGDGTEITADVSDSTSTYPIESFGQCTLKISSGDVKQYFEYISSLATSRFNTIGLFSGVKMNISSGYDDYVNVRLFSVVTFDNEAMKIPKEMTYIYRVYAAV